MDHAGPYLGKLFLILIDAHSKWIEAHIVSSTAADVTIAKLCSVFAIHGIPEQLVPNNESCFSSEEFKIFTKENGIHHTFTSPYHPASNGLAERAVQRVKGGIAKMEGDIGQRLDRFLMTYRVTPQASTGVSPAELLMGRRLRTRLDRIQPAAGSTVIKKQEKQEENSIHPGKGPCQFAVEDRLYAQNFIRGKDKWIPVKVMKVTGPVSYRVVTNQGHVLRRHLNQLRCRFSSGENLNARRDFPDESEDFDDWPLLSSNPTNDRHSSSSTRTDWAPTTALPQRSTHLHRLPERYAPLLS